MATFTEIAWAHSTFNPWRGCVKISPGCTNCYAEAQSHRNPAVLGEWGPGGKRAIAAESYWRQPVVWDRKAKEAGERRRVFCLSLGDVFEDRAELVPVRRRLGALIAKTPSLDWILLTKRPENWRDATREMWVRFDDSYPLPDNVWLGVSVEDQQRADERIPLLLQVPARVRFLSVEPLLGPVDLCSCNPKWPDRHSRDCRLLSLDWVIIGGESGPRARPCHVEWVRSLVQQCKAAGTPCFIKQLGSKPVIGCARCKDNPYWGRTLSSWTRCPDCGLKGPRDPKGGDPAEWPADLRVREFPRIGKDQPNG